MGAIDIKIDRFLRRYSLQFLRISVAVVYFWFGFIKFFPGWSPGEVLVGKTMSTLTFGLFQPEFSLPFLALWESFIGIGLLFKIWPRFVLISMLIQMLGTLSVFVLFPSDCFIDGNPLALSLVGQYIIKNLIILASGIFIGATLRGQAISRNPEHVGKV